ncbi:Retrovirus-related Pol polyprotein from transposon TNT 1-94 [Dendrobium catenatum]|uniref:Retrovirus-related Pol polyprotein from transposon TNT 1-94 n=1 Tax=Dendrobium catenatum TaxID=906689 RepID=A0A2I0VYL3_9ASPA|nr:Retrovirus-related Pol polyprotein from transposon TNT 1-94 [Dendrobium catenatum]
MDSITVGNGQSLPITHTGTGLLPTPARKLTLSQIHHVPTISHNLLSVSHLTHDNNVSVVFSPSGFCIKDLQTQATLLQGPCRNGLYTIRIPPPASTSSALSATSSSSYRWHTRLGHPHPQVLASISQANRDLAISTSVFTCSTCKAAKSHKLVFPVSSRSNVTPLALLHFDVWGPTPTISHQGYKYYLVIIDDFSRFTWLFMLRAKSEVPKIIIHFKIFIENQLSHKIKCIQTDGGSEFTNNELKSFLQNNGIHHRISCPYTPEQNGMAERKNRHIIETTRTLLQTAHLPYQFWPDAALTAVHLINRMPSVTIQNKTPFELLHQTKPTYSHLKTFGCACYPWTPPSQRHKLEPKASQCLFLGYHESYKGYKCLNVSTNKILFSRHVTFEEDLFPFSLSPTHPSTSPSVPASSTNPYLLLPTSTLSTSHVTHQPSNSPTTPTSPTEQTNLTSQPTTPPHTTSSPPPIPSSHPMITRLKTGTLKPRTLLNLLHKLQPISQPLPDPTSYSEAVKIPQWREAMALEFLALQQQGTWLLVPPPPNANVLGSRWTYRTKYHSNGTIARYKARLVAQGHRQEHGLDYHDTFCPVAKMPTIRVFLLIALNHSWPIHQMDVANAFLHGDLHETVYMTQPKGFEDNINPSHVCLLKKAIYGLKQAPRQWFHKFSSYIISYGFKQSQSDHSLFVFSQSNIQIYLLIYVDDILLSGNHSQTVSALINQLSKQFTIKYLGTASHFLGIQIHTTDSSLFLSQSTYAKSILHQAGLTACKPLSNPNCTKLPTTPFSDPILHNPLSYKQFTGSLQYLTITRPDISYSVNVLCQHMHDPQPVHYHLLKRLLRYIQGTTHFGLPISKGPLQLMSMSDADWASDPITRRSTSGYCSFLGSTLISWSVKKQHTVARSSTEAEYRAIAAATADILWLRKLLHDFNISIDQPTILYCDNMSAIAIANNPVLHARTKHIEIDHHFIRDHLHAKHIALTPISTVDQIADIFTKSLSTSRFQHLRFKLTVQTEPSICMEVLEHTSTDRQQHLRGLITLGS